MSAVAPWQVTGDWFDVCKCGIPCPCTFAQAPTYGDCEGILAWHIREGPMAMCGLDGLNVVALGSFEGNIWAGETKVTVGMYMDERADEAQREALHTHLQRSGRRLAGPLRSHDRRDAWDRIRPDHVRDRGRPRLLGGRGAGQGDGAGRGTDRSHTPPGHRVQLHNPPGAEVGPGQIATWGTATIDRADGFGFKWEWDGRSSKHFPFDWQGP